MRCHLLDLPQLPHLAKLAPQLSGTPHLSLICLLCLVVTLLSCQHNNSIFGALLCQQNGCIFCSRPASISYTTYKSLPASQRCTMASASLGLSYGTCYFGSAPEVENKRDTDHMACTIHSSKRKPFRTPGLSSDLSLN